MGLRVPVAKPESSRCQSQAPALRHRCLWALPAMSFAIVAAACGPLQLPQPVSGNGGNVSPAGTTISDVAPAANAAPIAPGAPSIGGGRIALLLPLAGAQRPVAEAVRDGFLAAYLAAGSGGPRPEILILDEEQPDATGAYRTAVAAGAGLVVGPLLKQSVAQVAGSGGAVTTLALNFLESEGDTPAGIKQVFRSSTQFSLVTSLLTFSQLFSLHFVCAIEQLAISARRRSPLSLPKFSGRCDRCPPPFYCVYSK